MIGKIMTGKSFRGCLLYCLNDKLQKEQNDEAIFKNRSEIIMFNKCFGNQKELIQQFNEVRQLNPKLSKPVLHITLSFAKGEQLDNSKLISISEACAKDLGFEDNQYVAVLHKDTEHQHLHIVANRISFDKRTVSDSNNYKKIANFCRKTEMKHNLQQVLSPTKFLPKELRGFPRNDERKEKLKVTIRRTLFQSKDCNDFQMKMEAQGYKVIKGRGIAFIDDKKVKIKGSEVDYSLQKIEQRLEFQYRLKTDREFFKQVIERKPFKSLTRTVSHVLVKDENISITGQLKRDISEAVDTVLRPEQIHEQSEPKLLMKKKRKKKTQKLH